MTDECERPHIKQLIFSGGGAKGVVYVGAYEAMKNTGVLENVETIAGASIGAVTAAFVALGVDTEVLRRLVFSMQFKDLLGNKSQHKDKGICFLTRDGKTLEDFIRTNLLDILKQKLSAIDSDDVRYINLKKRLQNGVAFITFSDFAMLNELFPAQFKKIAFNAVDAETGEQQIFDDKQTPDVEVAIACRASASLPVILEPVKIYLNGRWKTFVDGGLYSNFLTEPFEGEGKSQQESLVFAFGESRRDITNPVFKAMHGRIGDKFVLYKPGMYERFERNYLVKVLAKLKLAYTNTRRKEVGFQKLREHYPLRTVQLHVGKLKTQHFKQATKCARVMAALGYLDSINYVVNHDLQKPHFKIDDYNEKLFLHFRAIYEAVLFGSGKSIEKNALLKKIQLLGCKLAEGKYASVNDLGRVTTKESLYLIKETAENNIDSLVAYALARAVEVMNGQLNSENLFKEVYQKGFSRAGFFSRSKLAGKTIYSQNSLQNALAKQSLFVLYQSHSEKGETRTAKIYRALSKIDSFSSDSNVNTISRSTPAA